MMEECTARVPAMARWILGVPIHPVTMSQAINISVDAITHRRRLNIGVVNAAKLVNMRRLPILRDAVMSSDLILADGMAVVWAGRLLRQSLPERVAGIDLFENLLAEADRRAFSVYLLGASTEVLDEVVRQIRHRFPNLRIAGSRNGYFRDADSQQVAQQVRDATPDMLFLAMTSPKKELFMEKWQALMDVPLCHGVGGSFDVMAGKVKRAPSSWQRLGMEWFYRVVQEPRRMWKRYLVTNSIFLWLILREAVVIHTRPSVPANPQ